MKKPDLENNLDNDKDKETAVIINEEPIIIHNKEKIEDKVVIQNINIKLKQQAVNSFYNLVSNYDFFSDEFIDVIKEIKQTKESELLLIKDEHNSKEELEQQNKEPQAEKLNSNTTKYY